VKGAIDASRWAVLDPREPGRRNTVVEVKGAAAEVLAGGEARGLDALQLLANQVLLRRDEERRAAWCSDVEGGSDSRESHLERLAERW
jgi:predicted RNA-binding protein Jag